LIEHVPKVYKGRAESNGINSEDAQKREFNGEHLICSRDFNWNSHCELFVLILRRLLILFDEEPAAGLKNGSVRLKFGPNFKFAVALNEAKCWVEFEIGLEVSREEKLHFHGSWASIVEHNFLPIELFIDHHIQVVLLLLDIDWYIDTFAHYLQWNRFWVILIVEEQSQLLRDARQFCGDESELDLGIWVAFDLSNALETDRCYEFIENYFLGSFNLVLIFG